MDNMCRVCLVKDPSSVMRPLADKRTRELLIECTSISITPGDNYPQQLCIKCWIQCKNCSAFQTLARDSDRRLRLENEGKEVKKGNIVNFKEELIDEDLTDRPLKLEKENRVMCEREEVTVTEELMDEEADELQMEVKEEHLDCLQGSSLASESADEEDSIPSEDEEENIATTEGPSHFTPNKCGFCSKTFSKLVDLTGHLRTHHKCGKCLRMFKDKKNFMAHQCSAPGIIKRGRKCEKESEEQRYLVPSAYGRKFIERSDLEYHQCPECDKKFLFKLQLIRHKKTHLGTETFECD